MHIDDLRLIIYECHLNKMTENFKYQRMIKLINSGLKKTQIKVISFLRNNLKTIWFHLFDNILILSNLVSLP